MWTPCVHVGDPGSEPPGVAQSEAQTHPSGAADGVGVSWERTWKGGRVTACDGLGVGRLLGQEPITWLVTPGGACLQTVRASEKPPLH